MTSFDPSCLESGSELDAIFQRSPLAILLTRDKVVTRCNSAFEAMFACSQADLLGRPARHIFSSEEDYQAFAGIAREALRQHQALDLNWTFHTHKGHELRARVRAQAVDPAFGQEATVWLIEDISASWEQAQVLHSTVRELEALMKNAPVAIIFTVNRRLTRANGEFCRMFGYSHEQALGLGGRDLFPSDEIYDALGAQAVPRLSRGESVVYETHMQRANGEVFWAQLIAYVLNHRHTAEGTIWLITDRSEAKRHEQAIKQALFENQVILDSAVVGIAYVRKRVVERCNPLAEQIFAYPPGGMVGHSTREWYLSQEDFDAVGREVYPAIVAGETYRHERRMMRRNGEAFWCRLSGQVLDPLNPIDGGSIWVVEDTSERHAAEEALLEATTLMRAVFDSAKVSIIVTGPDGMIRLMNQTAEQWLGYSAAELVGRVTPRQIHDDAEIADYARQLSAELGQPVEPGFDAFVARARVHGQDESEWHYIRKDGSRLPVHLTTSVLRDRQGKISGYIGVAVDITDRRRADEAMRLAQLDLEERVARRTAELADANRRLTQEIVERQAIEAQMRQMAHYDSLTGLPNRNLLLDRLHQALALARRHGSKVGLMFIDLDHFKEINDTLGHDVGDLVLTEVARRIQEVLRETDTLARLGGDEFVLLAPDAETPARMARIADKIIAAMTPPILSGETALRTSPSIGIACFPEDGNDAASLMRSADLAMYQAKTGGRNNYRFAAVNTVD